MIIMCRQGVIMNNKISRYVMENKTAKFMCACEIVINEAIMKELIYIGLMGSKGHGVGNSKTKVAELLKGETPGKDVIIKIYQDEKLVVLEYTWGYFEKLLEDGLAQEFDSDFCSVQILDLWHSAKKYHLRIVFNEVTGGKK